MVFAAKEVEEETGLLVRPVRLLALLDKRKHAHPPKPWYTYKAFIQCEVRDGASSGSNNPIAIADDVDTRVRSALGRAV